MSRFKILTGTAFVAAALAAAHQLVFSQVPMTPPPVLSVVHQPTQLPQARTLSGNYLAGRFAQRQQDWDSAQNYINTVIHYDRQNPALNERAFLLSLGAGQYSRARDLAHKLVASENPSDLAYIYLACEALSRDDFDGALAQLENLPEDGFGQYTKPLLTAWTYAGQGRTDEALALLRAKARPSDPTYNVHAALIEEMAGRKDDAALHFQMAVENGLTLHAAVLAAHFFDNLGQPEKSREIYARLGQAYPFNTFSDTKTGAPNITRASQGAGIALFDLATLLYEKRAYDSAQVYGSLVQLLYPSSPFVLMMMGDIAALNGRYGKALANYDAIRDDSPLYWFSRMRIAEIDEARGRPDLAEKLLIDLAKSAETRLPALATLGDMYRRQSRFADAVRVYDEALGKGGEKSAQNWSILYARGMALERDGDWGRAENDLLGALELQPNNANILNFIGYSWIEKGVNLERALSYTRRAAELQPYDGYILDSYGWALYRTGNRAQAVTYLERAVEEIPDDPTILDHLGDAYWQMGRKNEARFKWRHALEVSKDKAFKATAQKKIQDGLTDAPTYAAHSDSKI